MRSATVASMARRTLITGANRGLGLVIARLLIEAGDELYGSAREHQPEALQALQPAGMLQIDLGDEATIVAALATLGQTIAGLDLLINCAGVDGRAVGMGEDSRRAFDFDADSFTEVLRLNATAPMVMMREALPLLRNGTNPLILNVSSQLGSMQVAAKQGRDTAYCVSKAALNMYTVKAAAQLQPEGIAAVMLHPGWVQTDMGGESAPMTVVESASAIVSTLSSLTMADTGRFIRWDGTDHPW